MTKRLLLTGFVVSALTLTGCTIPDMPINAEAQTATETPVEPVEETKEPEPAETIQEENTLAQDTTNAVLESNVVNSFDELGPTSPGYPITGIDALNTTTIRVNVQETLTDEDRTQTATWVINHACTTVDALSVVVIRDASGVDSNHYKNKLATLPACK